MKSSNPEIRVLACLTSATLALAVLTFLGIPAPSAADTIADAYAKEFTYLKSQKTELQQRIDSEKANQARSERQARGRLEDLRSRYLELTAQVNDKQIALNRFREELLELKGGENVVDSVLLQMDSTLSDNDITVAAQDLPIETRISDGFSKAGTLVNKLSSVQSKSGVYYTVDGSRTEGTIVEIGNVALYGANNTVTGSGALVPAGGGNFRLWEQPGSSDDAVQVATGELPDSLSMFLIENKETEVAPPRQKTARSVIESGGVIGYIILGLGAIGLLLAFFRFIRLAASSGAQTSLVRGVLSSLGEGDIDTAWRRVNRGNGSVSAVLSDVVRHIDRDREALDDVITESVLRESIKLDRFGPLILVIASVAPLLGLLGTVTGMISTFDLITEFGTGDPKLLADGISIALVTTMLGLAVAIPLLLVGNLLSGWARRTKDSIERAALLAVNRYESAYARR